MPVFLHGLSLRNFRGIGPETQDLGPFRQFNFFIGANNAGKSTVLDFFARFLTTPNPSASLPLGGLDIHLGASLQQVDVALAKPIQDVIDATIINSTDPSVPLILARLIKSIAQKDLIWFKYSIRGGVSLDLRLTIAEEQLRGTLQAIEWRRLYEGLTRFTGGSIENWVGEKWQPLQQDSGGPSKKLFSSLLSGS